VIWAICLAGTTLAVHARAKTFLPPGDSGVLSRRVIVREGSSPETDAVLYQESR
jgi:hypothetical protein